MPLHGTFRAKKLMLKSLRPSYIPSLYPPTTYIPRRSTDPRPQRGEPLRGGGQCHRRRRRTLQRVRRRGRRADAAGARPLLPLAQALHAALVAGGGHAHENTRHRPLLPDAEGLRARRDEPFLQGGNYLLLCDIPQSLRNIPGSSSLGAFSKFRVA